MPVSPAVLFLLSGFWFLTTFNDDAGGLSDLDKITAASLVAMGLAAQMLLLAVVALLPRKLALRLLAAVAVAASLWAFIGALGAGDILSAAAVFVFWGAVFVLLTNPQAAGFLLRRESLLAALAAGNLYSLYLCFVTELAALPATVTAGLLVVAWFVARQFFASLSEGGRGWRAGVMVFCALLFAASGARTVSLLFAAPAAASPPGKTASENIRVVPFAQKPNVYFFAMESMIPESLTQKIMGLDFLPHQEYLRGAGFRVFRNAFSDSILTIPSLSRMLAMDPAYYKKLAAEGRERDLFSGRAPSPLWQIFRANGYAVHAYNRNAYTGRTQGDFVDGYHIFASYSLCAEQLPEAALAAGFFGYCRLLKNAALVRAFGLPVFPRLTPKAHLAHILADVAPRLNKRPLFVFARLHALTHIKEWFDGSEEQLAEFREQYALLSEEVPALMEEIVAFVRQNDPDALLFFFGDHGIHVSDSMGEIGGLNPEDKIFAVQDRYGILAAFRPKDACRPSLDAAQERGFVTPAMISRAIVRCLADGEDPVVGELPYRIFPEHGIFREHGDLYKKGYQGDSPGLHRDYLYE